jgi:LmbE family N-acetylglucosaminyl deacetylase
MFMQSLTLVKNKRAIAIVAHPDDEIIFMGGTIMKNPQIDWTVFSLCRASDKDREPKFWRVCAKNKVKGIIADVEDKDKMNVAKSVPVIAKIITAKLKNKQFDYIFTHGANGEYGHKRHSGVHQAVSKLIDNKILKPEAVFYFNYKKISRHVGAPFTVKAGTDYLLKLSPTELKKKKEIVAYMYGYEINGIDVSYCTNPEAFKKVDIK